MPLIGLLSDSHGRVAATRSAVRLLLNQGAEVLIHLGDVESVAVIDELVVSPDGGGRTVEAHVVFGNVDDNKAGLGRYAAGLGLIVDHPVGRMSIGGSRELVFLHGDDAAAMERALADGVAYLCHGHTHRRLDERRGKTRVINPGALHRAVSHTVAILDTDADRVTFHGIDDPG